MTTPGQIDIIATQIVLDAKAALAELKKFDAAIKASSDAIKVYKDLIKTVAKQMGGDFKLATDSVASLARTIRANTASIKEIGKELQNISALAKKMGISFDAASQIYNKLAIVATTAQGAVAGFGASFNAAIASNLPPLVALQTSLTVVTSQIALMKSLVSGGVSNAPLLGSGQGMVSRGGGGRGGEEPPIIDAEWWDEPTSGAKKYLEEVNNAGNKTEEVGNKIKKTGEDGGNAFRKIFNAVNILKIALGTVVAMIVFQVIQAFSNMVRTAIKGLNEMEAAMFNLANAEEKLSKMGVDVTPEGLKELIADLQVLDPMLTKFQATELVSTLASKVAPAARLSEKELRSLAEAITILAVRNQALGKSFEEVEQQVITGILSGRVTSGINQLGAKITDQAVQEEVLRQELVANAEAYKKLNAEAKARVDILAISSLLKKDQDVELKNLPEFMKTVSGLMGIAKKEGTDILTNIGETLAPFIKSVLKIIISFLEKIGAWLDKNRDSINRMAAAAGFLLEKFMESKALIPILKALAFNLLFAFKIMETGIKIFDAFLDRFPKLKAAIDSLPNRLPESDWSDTPTEFTGAPGINEEQQSEDQKKAEEHGEKLADIMQENADKLADIEKDYKRKIEDINSDYSQRLTDLAINTARKRKDAEREYAEKIEDINRDANQKILDAQEDYHQKEIDREEEFQRKLRELREKFLFDLEDALRERDARGVLRLIRQYNMDKKNLEERRQLEAEEGKKTLAQKLEDIERERQEKLAAAKREYNEKLADIKRSKAREIQEINTWHKRQMEDAHKWYQRQLQDQREYLARKLADLQAAYSQELQMQQNFQKSLGNMVQVGTGGILTSTETPSFPSYSDFTPVYTNPYDLRSYGYGFAEGGTLIAKKPTLAMFGEKSPEMVHFQPVGRHGTNVNKIFGDIGGLGETGGQISLRVSLSDGLVAEIIDTSLTNMSAHIEQTRRLA